MNHLLSLAMLLLMPVSQSQTQDLPREFYQLPEQVRDRATVIATGTYGQGRSPCIMLADGTRVWALEPWFQITKVYRGKVGGQRIRINSSRSPKTKYVSAKLETGREYLVLLRPNSESLKVLEAGEYVPVWDALSDDEIVAIVPLD